MSALDDSEDATARCLHVLSDIDGYKYKLVLQGDVGHISIRRIKKYLHKAAGVAPAQQLLSFNGVALRDGMYGSDAGLFDGAILRLQQTAPTAQQLSGPSPSSTTLPRGLDEAWYTASAQESYTGGGGRPSTPPPVAQQTSAQSNAAASAASPAVPRSTRGENYFHSGVSRGQGSSPHTAAATHPFPYAQPAIGAAPPASHYLPPTTEAPFVSPFSAPANALQAMGDAVDDSAPAESSRRHLEAKVNALSIENVRLREQLQLAARQAAEARSDWRQEEEVTRLKAAVEAARQSAAGAEAAAAQRWRIKEEELVRELDRLREERRRVQEDAAAQEAKVQELLHSMEGEVRSLRYDLHDRDEALQSLRVALANRERECADLTDTQPATRRGDGARAEPLEVLASDALSHLSYVLSAPAPLQLDADTDTCVVPVSDALNALVTLDRETEHLYLYVTLLNGLPPSPVLRLRLYEMLLQAALLGKDTAGAAVGVSLESDLVLMSLSADLRHNGAFVLAAAAPSFVESALVWAKRIDELLRL